jgi:hypothetical protein
LDSCGLFGCLDYEYAEHNPEMRGHVASQQAKLEGLSARRCSLLSHWRQRRLQSHACTEDRRLAAAMYLAERASQAWLVTSNEKEWLAALDTAQVAANASAGEAVALLDVDEQALDEAVWSALATLSEQRP